MARAARGTASQMLHTWMCVCVCVCEHVRVRLPALRMVTSLQSLNPTLTTPSLLLKVTSARAHKPAHENGRSRTVRRRATHALSLSHVHTHMRPQTHTHTHAHPPTHTHTHTHTSMYARLGRRGRAVPLQRRARRRVAARPRQDDARRLARRIHRQRRDQGAAGSAARARTAAAWDTHHAVWDTVLRGIPCRAAAYHAVVWDAVARGALKRSKWMLPLHLSPEHS